MRVSRLFTAVQTAASRPTNAEKEGKKYAPKKYVSSKETKEERKKTCTTNTKKYAERAWPCGRAASGRVAWRGALKKYVPKPGQNLLPDGADGRSAAYKTKKKGQKKAEKRGLADQEPRLSRSARFRRPECGGGVCQPGGWLGCTLYAGSS